MQNLKAPAVFIARRAGESGHGGNLNLREILNPIFFSRIVRHPDRKRQRSARQRTLLLRGARKVKVAL